MFTETLRAQTLDEISRKAAEFIIKTALISLKYQRVFSLVLAGGKTPQVLYEYLASPPSISRMPWGDIHLFFGDERWVAHDHHDSNYSMAYQTLLSKIPIPAANIHRIPTDLEDPETGAKTYESALHDYFNFTAENKNNGFDMILLGMGEDGHTASLFPSSSVIEIENKWVAAVASPSGSPAVPRITLTLSAINNAKHVLFLISGTKKQTIQRAILNNPVSAADKYPAARVQPKSSLKWFIADQ